jgi:hypothetical protein
MMMYGAKRIKEGSFPRVFSGLKARDHGIKSLGVCRFMVLSVDVLEVNIVLTRNEDIWIQNCRQEVDSIKSSQTNLRWVPQILAS